MNKAEGGLTTTAANLSTRAIVVTRHRVFQITVPATGRSSSHSGFFGELQPDGGANALSTQRRAHGMTNVAAAANVAAQQIIFQGDKIYPRGELDK